MIEVRRRTSPLAGGLLVGSDNLMSAGRGWISIALVIFSSWNPLRAALGCYLFGGINVLQLHLQAAGTIIPAQILLMLPYICTILVLLTASKRLKVRRIGAPAALGIPYERDSRE